MPLSCKAEVYVDCPIARVFEAAAARTARLSRYFTGHGLLIPAIRSAKLLDRNDPPVAGALREVILADDSRIVERVLAFEAPKLHRYEMAEMNKVQKLFCTNMIGEWRFTAQGQGTWVAWDYEIHEQGFLGKLLGPLVAKHFERAMQTCLDNLAKDLGAAG